jgi:aconitate hydratase
VASTDSFGAQGTMQVGGAEHEIYRLSAVEGADRLPYSLKVLLENLLRTEDGANVTADHVRALAGWDPTAEPDTEIQFTPARVIMQDFTGVPCVVDLATMREAVTELGGDAAKVNPLAPAELVIDHSVIIDVFGTPDAFERNVDFEYGRNKERYQFLRWGQGAFDEFKVVPPGTGIVHQVNIEHLARVVMTRGGQAYPDTLVGTDSHTTMVNGLGVLGWGVGGIEAEAAMLGQPVSMLIPKVVGFKLSGEIPAGATATDVVLTITEMLRRQGVVGKFVEFYGEGVGAVPLANRATIGNMSPEFGSTAAIFPIDDETLRYLTLTGRSKDQIALVEAYAKEQGMWHDPAREAVYSETLELDLSTVVPSIAGPKRPQDRIALSEAKEAFRSVIGDYAGTPDHDDPDDAASSGSSVDEASEESFPASDPASPAAHGNGDGGKPRVAVSAAAGASGRVSKPTPVTMESGTSFDLDHGAVVIASITSCTNTSNPSVMLGAALLAKNAVDKGLAVKPWVKTVDGPGLAGRHRLLREGRPLAVPGEAGLPPGRLRLHHLHRQLRPAARGDLGRGQRGRPGRRVGAVGQPELRGPDQPRHQDELPGLAAAGDRLRAGRHDGLRLRDRALGQDSDGNDVFLRDLWPSAQDVQATIDGAISQEMFTKDYADVFAGDERWKSLPTPEGQTFEWDPESTYVRKPPYFEGMSPDPTPVEDISGARVLALLGDSVTTDHISPAGSIKEDTPAGQYLVEHGVGKKDFNSYGSRRGNHEVMIRGTFANIRLRNQLLDGVSGGYTRDFTQDGAPQAFIYDAAQNYAAQGTPLVVLGGKEYGSGSSRDWAAKGTALLGVKAVIVESYERIHRSNLIGMGVLPLQFPQGESAASLGLDGTETFDVSGVTALNDGSTPRTVHVTATKDGGEKVEFDATVRIDTPGEADYYRNGGIMQYVLRGMLRG